MAAPSRFAVLGALPAVRGFRRAVAVDRERGRAVVLSAIPPAVASDGAARAALVARVDAAAALRHPGIAAVLGTAATEDGLAALEEHRPGPTLRELLDAAGRLPPELAARAFLDAAEGLARAHALDAAGARLAHGALDPSAVGVDERGAAFVSGLGLVVGAEPAEDVRALGAVLHECLAGEPPGAPPRPLDAPGIPAPLSAAVDRALGVRGEAFPSVAAFAEAVAAAVAPAAPEALAAYADAVVPSDAGARAALRRAIAAALGEAAEELAAELVVDAEPPAAPRSPPAEDGGVPADAVRVFAAPVAPRARRAVPIVVGIVALALGFATGLCAERAARPPPSAPAPSPQ